MANITRRPLSLLRPSCLQRIGAAKHVNALFSTNLHLDPSAHLSKNYIVKVTYYGSTPRPSLLLLRRNHSLYSPTVVVRNYGTLPEVDRKPDEQKLSLYQRFKAMYRDYWYVLLPVHMATSTMWFGGIYFMARSGVDIVAVLESIGVGESILDKLRNGHATSGYLAVTFALYKILTPLRYTVTLGGTTLAINYLKQWGYIKPVPNKEKLKLMYEDKKEVLKEKGKHLKDNMVQSIKHSTNDKGVKTTE